MTYIYPAGRLLHSQSAPHRAFAIVELCQPVLTGNNVGNLFLQHRRKLPKKKPLVVRISTTPESYRHLQDPLMLFSSHIPPLDQLVQYLAQFKRVNYLIQMLPIENKGLHA